MPFILLFLLLLAGTIAYIYFSRNADRYTHQKDTPDAPAEVIYLPGDTNEPEQTDKQEP